MEVETSSRGARKRTVDSVWEVQALRASLEERSSSPLLAHNNFFFPPKRQRHRLYVLVRTVSGTTIRVEPFADQEDRLMFIGDIKRSLRDDHGMNLESTALLLDRKNVTDLDNLEVESGATLYAILRVGGCSNSKTSSHW